MDLNQENQDQERSDGINLQPQKFDRRRLASKYKWQIIVLVVAVACYGFGYRMGRSGYIYLPKEFKVVNQSDQAQTVDYNLLWDAVNTVNQKYIDRPIDQQKVLYGAVKGAVEAIGDPYTTYFTPSDLNNFETSLKGSFDGIGAEVGKKDGNIVIVAPLDGMPAQAAGLKAQDIIAKVNGEAVSDWSVEQAVDKIRGPKGTKVTLTIVRQGKNQPFDVTITRDTIRIKSVKWEVKTVNENGASKKIAIISISQYGDDTDGLFSQAVNEILQQGVQGIIVDERNNPGGYLQSAVDIASSWVNPGDVVVTEAHSDGTSQIYKAEGNNRLADIKTIVLINGGSASAAEIFAGALHDHKKAELVGEKSFGKGSVQELVDLKEGGAVKVTVAKWITPGGINLNHNGLDPDIKAGLTDSDVTAGKDPQMDSAVKELFK
ncbi:MAG: S41 family peptidase [Patescibacteria group bacterium]|nr:S41 family peptidase [Patescibacteria group bacterium]